MSGAEAGAVLGLISSIITVIATAKELYETANDVHGLPDALGNAETKLPLILEILKEAESYTRRPDIEPNVFDAFEKILIRGKKKANELLDILEKVLPKERASTFNRYWSATRQLAKVNRVESLMKALLEEMQTLTSYLSCPTIIKTSVKEALEEFQVLTSTSNERTDLKALREIKYNTAPSYSDLRSKHDLEEFILGWLLPENLPGASFETDQIELLKRRFCDPENSFSTCDWMFETAEYSKLIDLSCASVLRIKGPSRCGKSVLMSAVIEKLREDPPPGNASPHVLFCYAHDRPEPVNPTTLVRLLLAQCLQWQNDQILREINVFYLKQQNLQEIDKKVEKQLWLLLRTIISFEPGKINIVLDGLDECASPLILVQHLMKVAVKTKAGILLSSRREAREVFHHETIQSTVQKYNLSLLQLEMTKERIHPDLMKYVTHKVDTHNAFTAKSQEIRGMFVKGVCDRANGMFLYASLVLKDLGRGQLSSRSVIDATLASLPQGLLEIYRHHLNLPRHSLKGPETFCWIYCASLPLSWHELQSALAIGESGYDEGEIIDDSCEAFIEYSCGQLIESYGDSERLRFIHPTVKDFLDENLGPGNELGTPKAHSMVANKLLTFLEYPDLPFFSSSDIEENSEEIVRAYSSQCGRGLYSYATYNWYGHLKECDKGKDVKLEQHVLKFLMSPAIIRWLKSSIIIAHATGYGPTDSVSLTADVIHSLQTWMMGRKWSDLHSPDTVQAWIKDFVDLMLDWGKVLETQADWIHYIHHQLLPEHSCFRQILMGDGDESVVQFHPRRVLTKSSQIATWPDHFFATDMKRDLAFTYYDKFISCYHMQTGLLTAEINIPFPKHRGSLVLRKGVLCSQRKYIAAIFEVKSEWNDPVKDAIRSGLQLVPEDDGFALKLENPATSSFNTWMAYMSFGIDELEFVVCLLQLNHGGPARSHLFSLPTWATNPVLVTGKQSLRWELDDVDALTFSSDSNSLVTPFGIYDLENGGKVDPWSFARKLISKSGKTTESIDVFNTITQIEIGGKESAIGFRGIHWETAENKFSEMIIPGIGHLLATSNRGRYLLVLRVQTVVPSKSRRLKPSSGQQGSIEIYDCTEKSWTSLLLLDPAVSGSRAPWDLSPYDFPSLFSPEAKEPDEVNRVLIYVPPKWKLSTNVRNQKGFDLRVAQLLVFEAKKTGNPEEGFGQYPTLRHTLPADAFRRAKSSSDNRLTILTWSAQFESATVYSNKKVILMTQDDMHRSASDLLKARKSKKNAAKLKDSHIQDYFALIFSVDHSASFHIRIRRNPSPSNENALSNKSHQHCLNEMKEPKVSLYEISVACLRTGETEPEFFSVNYEKLPTALYPPLESQPVYASDDECLSIGYLELNLCHDYDGTSIEVKDPSETVFGKALQCFKQRAHPLEYLDLEPETALTKKHPRLNYTIFDRSEIVMGKGDERSDLSSGNAFLARGSKTVQEDLHVFEFSRCLDNNPSTDFQSEARRFEVYLCLYNEMEDNISWLVHSITAGETSRSLGPAPETAWVLHPQLPLLVWLLPGHRLRLSNIETNHSPITIAESLIIEDNSTQPMLFSPDGRYLALKAQETFKYPWTYNLSQSIGSIMLCDLVEGKTIIASPTVASNVSIDIDNEYLRVYNLTREGGVQRSSYQLPSLELKQRQYLTFVPADCCCSSCGKPIQENSNISMIKHHGVRFVALSHVPMKIGITTIGTVACEPLMLRITSPPVDLNLETIHDALLTVTSAKLFPKVLSDEGELLADAFARSLWTCYKKLGAKCSCPMCIADALPTTRARVGAVPQMQTIIVDYKMTTGERIQKEDVEERIKKFETDKANTLEATEEDALTPEDVKKLMGEEAFPWDSWGEFSEYLAETRDVWDHEAHLEKFYEPGNRGVGCRIPVLVQTFLFDQQAETDFNFRWSSAIGVGWTEEDIKIVYRRIFSGSGAGTRRWYTFPAFETLVPRIQDLAKDKSLKGKRFRRIYGKKMKLGEEEVDLEALANAPASDKAAAKSELDSFQLAMVKKNGEKLKSRAPIITIKEGEMWDPLLPINDILDSMNDVVPGMGDIFKHRMKSAIMQDLISGD